jgi:hypothetical protein
VVCHTSRCAPLQTRNLKSSRTFMDEWRRLGSFIPW